jgi:hypothetical protein
MLSGSLVLIGLADGQHIHKNGFETMKMGWLKGGFDAPNVEKTHAISDQVAHEGRHSEYIRFEAQQGSFIHYAYQTGKAVIGEELMAGIWLKSNRPGMQIMARVVLPRERDPQNLDHLLTTYIRGDLYTQAGQWQHLELARPMVLAKQQQQLLQAKLNRPFDFTDAYIDGLVLNVYGGPGPTDVWIDDVEVGPITAVTPIRPAVGPAASPDVKVAPGVLNRPESKGQPELEGIHLKVGRRPFLFRGIFVTDTPLAKLREARFNTVFVPASADAGLARQATDNGLWVVPMLSVVNEEAKPIAPEDLTRSLARFNDSEVLFVDVGNTLPSEQAALVKRSASAIRQLDAGWQVGGDVWDGMMRYSDALNLLGVHRWPLMTTLELPRYREWLRQRRDLGNPTGVFLWTSVQTHMPDALSQLLYERPAAGAFEEPIGPQAECVQLLTYTALAAGCKGLAFSSDRFLADSHMGRDRLLACALMNLELEMLEPLIAGASFSPEWVETSSSEVKAAVIRSPLGVLVLPVWQGPFGQFVPGQAALSKLKVNVPPMPPGMEPWLVSPADVRRLKWERLVGTSKVTVPEFGLTAAIVFTSSNDLIARFQEQAKGRRQLAAQWAHDMAAYELDKVLKVQDQLAQTNHVAPDAQSLIADAQRRLKEARSLWESRAFPEAYLEAQRSLRPLRILMRAEWEKAVRGTDSPVVTPYTASFFTLPRHWHMMEQITSPTMHWGANVLPGGDFETLPRRPEDTWRLEDPAPLDEVELIAQRVGEVTEPDKKEAGKDANDPMATDVVSSDKAAVPAKASPLVKAPPREGKLCAMLKIEPRPKTTPPAALERAVIALSSPTVKLPPGTIVRVSGWMCIPKPITASADGALLYDSIGGDGFAIRMTAATPWKKFTFYRRVPASGSIQMTLALTGIGTVFFDDIRIEPLLPISGAATASVMAR